MLYGVLMSRVKLSEFRAKTLLFGALQQPYAGVTIDLADNNYKKVINNLPPNKLYVSKVDQAQKKRGKTGLVNIKRTKKQLLADTARFAKQGFRYAIIEPYFPHEPDKEKYAALLRTPLGVELTYSTSGGIDIESQSDMIERAVLNSESYDSAQNSTGLDDSLAAALYDLFQKSHMTLLEINPFIDSVAGFMPLDAAAEVDSAAQFFVNGRWSAVDIRNAGRQLTASEQAVEILNSKSPASLSLKVLNPNGSIFLLLSGGGASVVVADELAHLNHHQNIANYGEYSGNPNKEETYIYTKEILNLMLASKARKKILVIAGGVANFTDVAKTFAGIIRAMRELSAEIGQQKIKVFVRRGGPNQQVGLESMNRFLDDMKFSHEVYGPDKSLAEVMARVARAAT